MAENDILCKLKETVAEAEFVLVGLGEEWTLDYEQMIEGAGEYSKGFARLLALVFSTEQYEKEFPYFERLFYKKAFPAGWKAAYQNLHALLEGKKCFIVSLTMDDYLKQTGFSPEKIVNPCGNYDYLKCTCENRELVAADELYKTADDMVEAFLEKEAGGNFSKEDGMLFLEKLIQVLRGLRCPCCGECYEVNSVAAKNYNEAVYLPQWEKYMSWLTKTVNRKLCILELGVGFQFPTVIKLPFEKTALYNQKATLFRVHAAFAQANQEIAERTVVCRENAPAFLTTLFQKGTGK